MWSVDNIITELPLYCFDEYSKSGIPKGLNEFLVGKVISYMSHDICIFKTGKNCKRNLRIISVEFNKSSYRSQPSWLIKLQSCSKNGLINKTTRIETFSLSFILDKIITGKISIFEPKKDGEFQIKANKQLTELKMKLNGQKSHYSSVKRDLEATEKRIKDLEEQIENFGK